MYFNQYIRNIAQKSKRMLKKLNIEFPPGENCLDSTLIRITTPRNSSRFRARHAVYQMFPRRNYNTQSCNPTLLRLFSQLRRYCINCLTWPGSAELDGLIRSWRPVLTTFRVLAPHNLSNSSFPRPFAPSAAGSFVRQVPTLCLSAGSPVETFILMAARSVLPNPNAVTHEGVWSQPSILRPDANAGYEEIIIAAGWTCGTQGHFRL